MIEVLKVINEIDLKSGTYGQALVLTDGKNTAIIPMSDKSLGVFMATFREYMDEFSNEDNDEVADGPTVEPAPAAKPEHKPRKKAADDSGLAMGMELEDQEEFNFSELEWEPSQDETEEEDTK